MELPLSPVLVGLLLTLFTYLRPLLADIPQISKPDKPFAKSTILYGRNVSCSQMANSTARFPAETWACHNMTVDGKRLRYWYLPGFGAKTHCGEKDANPWDSYKGDDIAALCRQLFKAHGFNKVLWTAYINEASCQHSVSERMVFRKWSDSFKWETASPGRGYVITLRCMATE